MEQNQNINKQQKYILFCVASFLLAIFGGMFMLIPVAVVGGIAAIIFLIMYFVAKQDKNLTGFRES